MQLPQVRVFMIALLVGLALPAAAIEDRYDYDELGRLVRVVSNGAVSTLYRYDAAGNLLEITLDGAGSPPSVPELDFDSLRCGSETEITLVGEDFIGVRITTTSPTLQVSNVRYTDTGVTFTLTVDCSGEPGDYALLFTNAAGTTSVTIRINPQLPDVFVTPAPLAVPPDGSVRNILLRLSHADTVDHDFQIVASNDATLQVLTDALSIAAGETQVTGRIAGLQAGQAYLEITSSTLATRLVPVYVTADFAGVNTSYASLLGVTIVPPPATPAEREIQLPSAAVGISLGDAITGISPSTLLVDSGPTQVTVSGMGLSRASSIQVRPVDDLVIGNPVPAVDGESLAFTVIVSENAAATVRQVFVTRDDGKIYAPATLNADRLKIAYPPPIVESLTPIVLYPGDTAVPVTIRGRRLVDVQSVNVTPSEHVSTDQIFETTADGSELTARISISPEAQPGPRILTVTTAGGTSDATPSPANTLQIALESIDEIQALTAPALGLLKSQEESHEERHVGAYSPLLGLARPPVITSVEPEVGIVGTTVAMTLVGVGLENVDALQLLPGDDISVTQPQVAADGRSISATLEIASNAEMSTREVRVFAAGNAIPFAGPDMNRFHIVPPPPILHSISPPFLKTGNPSGQLLLRGENFRDAIVHIEPSEDIVVGGIVVSGDGTQLVVQIGVADTAATGPRLVEVVTPGGSSGNGFHAGNTVVVSAELGATYESLVAPALGLLKLADAEPPLPAQQQLQSHLLGVDKPMPSEPQERHISPLLAHVGVTKGPVIMNREPAAALPGQEVEIVVSGSELADAVSVSFEPSEGLTLTAPPTSNPDGDQVRFSVVIAPNAGGQIHRLSLQADNGTLIPFNDARHALFEIGHGVPEIDSIEPILAGQGDTATLIVRGRNLFKAHEVLAEPSAGLRFSPFINVNEAGTELTVRMAVDEDAPLGSRVIRVAVPGAVSTGIAAPANTFTVYESVPSQ